MSRSETVPGGTREAIARAPLPGCTQEEVDNGGAAFDRDVPDPPSADYPHLFPLRTRYVGTMFGVRIYEANAGTLSGVKRPDGEIMAEIMDFANRVRADNRGESELILSAWEWQKLATELQESRETCDLP